MGEAGVKPTGKRKGKAEEYAVLTDCRLTVEANPDSPDLELKVAAPLSREELPFLRDYAGGRIAGIIGAQVVRKMPNRLDFDRGMWELRPRGFPLPSPAQVAGTAAVLRIEPQRGQSDLMRVVAAPPSGEERVTFVLDTGSNVTFLPAGRLSPLLVKAEGTRKSGQKGVYYSVAGKEETEQWLLPSLVLPSQPGGVAATVAPFPVTTRVRADEGALGTDVLERFNIEIDPRVGTVTLEPRRRYKVRLPGTAGFQVRAEGKNFVVAAIGDPTTLLNGSLAPGDVVLSLDGNPLAELSPFAVVPLLDGYEGEMGVLTVTGPHGGERKVTFKRASRYNQKP
jgi:hypothetical protein